ncbi:DUF2911 domain-containing protein [Aquimarina intermedia]|uniref:Tetratricopeptide repeat protein n=1 Tax=Aquimarina intermedia TaxID=350814 RepID=A0A5S5C6Z9_9FLAO|nr:DUF2911 domain-containing protein [Aquimarina intermedia]TYP75124.1 tetratricopeptide repeat protein [Aquimarina intermedia]
MKKIILLLTATLLSTGVFAQVKTPQPSPTSKIEQVIGLTDVTVSYSRPSMRERTVFGSLVPFGKLWRTGANENTKITFSDDVKINGSDLKKGTYAIFTKPTKENWEVIFYSDVNNWGTPQKWDDAKVALKTTAKVGTLPMKVETFTIMFSDFKMDSAKLNFIWESTEAMLDIEVPSKKIAEESIQKTLAGPTANDYYQAAVFYKETGKIDMAKEYIDKAVTMRKEPAFWYHRQQSLIYAEMGNKEKAIEAAKKSLELAEKAGNADYVKMNKDSLKEWGS